MTSLWTHVWNWSQYINYLNATPCLKPNETGFMFDCWMQCSIMFDCLSVQFPKVWLCSIGQVFGWVQLCSIAEPNRSESNEWSSIGFNYRTFDWLRRVKSTLTARYAGNTFLFIWQRIGCCGKFWLWATLKPLYPTTIKREFIVNPRALMKRERAAILQQTQHLPHGWKLSRSK